MLKHDIKPYSKIKSQIKNIIILISDVEIREVIINP